MSRIRKLAVAGMTFSIALGIGFIMQNGDVLAARFGETAPASAAPALRPVARTVAAATAPAATVDCRPALAATPRPAGIVTLAVTAPCDPASEVTLHHAGMMITLHTDARGAASVNMPALDATAVFIAEIGGSSVVTVTDVAGVDRLDRAVLQSQGSDGLSLDAAVADAAAENIGQLAVIGDAAARNAHVFTLDRARIASGADVTLSLRAAITAANCGTTVTAQTMQFTPGHLPVVRDLAITLPGCDRIGQTVRVDGLLAPISIAAQPG